jgi:hypothetical protein
MAAISVAIRDILILEDHEMRVQLGLCSCALALVLMATAAWAEIRLSGTQIDAHVSGNTLKFTTKNLQEAKGYFIPDGTVKSRDGDRDFVGKWRVHDDMLCLEVPQFDNELCRTVVVRGDLLFLFTQTGEPAGSIDVTKGNPDHY